MHPRRVKQAPPRATISEQVSVGLASIAAPMLVALPLFYSLQFDEWPIVLGLAVVATSIAFVLLVGVTPTSDRHVLEVGLVWVFAGAGSALAFTGPGDTCLSTSAQADVMIGAITGAFAWPCFVITRRMLDALLPSPAS